MKTKLFLILLVAGMGLVAQCKKDNASFNAYFWTTDSYTTSNNIYLYVNGTNKGLLPNINLSCYSPNDTTVMQGGESVSLKQAATMIVLKSGKYTLLEKDSKGNVLSSSVLSISSNSMGSSGNLGGSCIEQAGNDLYANLYQ